MARMIKQTEVYRIRQEQEVADFIEKFKANQNQGGYELTKYESKVRTKKVKGEIIDMWYVVTIEKTFAEEEE